MEHVPSFLQAASLGGVGVILAQPDGGHLALYGVVFTGLCSIITGVIARRGDREREERKYAHEKEEREFQAAQVRIAFAVAGERTERAAQRIVAKVEESTQASAQALDTANHANEKLTRVTEALGDAVKLQAVEVSAERADW